MNYLSFLTAPKTCKRLNEASGERQTWLDQTTRLQIPIPTDVVLSTAELKDWAISWLESDKHWVKPRDDDHDRSLNVHFFKMVQEDDDEPAPFTVASLIPGGRFVVIVYTDGRIDLKEIITKREGKWELRDVTRYSRDDPEQFYAVDAGQLLTETNVGRPLVAYVDPGQRKYGRYYSGFTTVLTRVKWSQPSRLRR